MKILLYIISIALIISCNNKEEFHQTNEHLSNKSFTLNSSDNYSLDSIKTLTIDDFVKKTKDSITLRKTVKISEVFHFKNDSLDATIIIKSNNYSTEITFISDTNFGCIQNNPELLFVEANEDNIYSISLNGDEKCKPAYYIFNIYSHYMSDNIYTLIQSININKIRLIKNDRSYIDLILDEADSLRLFMTFRAIMYNSNFIDI